MWNPRGHVMEWNRQAEKVFGWVPRAGAQARMAEQLVSEGSTANVYAEMAQQAVAGSQVIEAT